jgi:bifunctional DNA-binding transcriptional regulator/antitoxin component of YhaV-PrlF toxin-antitoxin module
MRVSRKHQITLPVDDMRRAGIQPGDELVVELEAPGVLRLRRVDPPLDGWVGALTGVYGDQARSERKRAWQP